MFVLRRGFEQESESGSSNPRESEAEHTALVGGCAESTAVAVEEHSQRIDSNLVSSAHEACMFRCGLRNLF
jgi:hypothetical protein